MDNLHNLHWFEFADEDLDSAKILAEYGLRKANIACYHCQQAAEKYLKGYLIAKGVEDPPHIHNLFTLKAMCEDFDPKFSEIMPFCQELNPYGIRVRYPDEIEVDERDVRRAIADVQEIRAFAPIAAVREAVEAEHKREYAVTETAAETSKPSVLSELEEAQREAAERGSAAKKISRDERDL